MASLEDRIFQARRPLLALSAVALAVAIDLWLVVLAVRLAHHVVALSVVAGAVVVGLAVLGVLAARIARPVRRRTVVELDLDRLPEERPMSPSLPGAKPPLSMRDLVTALERAGRDRRVAGLVVHISVTRAGLAQVQELRDAIAAFRATGKFALAVAETFGELSAGNVGYYLATSCDEITLQPIGAVGLIGLKREATFVRGLLDRLGIVAAFEGRHEYKSAAAPLLQTSYSEPERAQEQAILDCELDQIVRGIATARRRSPEEVRALVDRGPFLAEEAVAAGLIDRLAYLDEVVAAARTRAGRGSRLLLLERYARRAPRRPAGTGRACTVAVITATGSIVRRANSPLPGPGGGSMDAGAVAASIGMAARNKRVKAIVLRVDSPGGSAVASERIYRAVVLASSTGTPVVVSMGNVAASGGYYLAAGADRIVAQPGTITGSIGVISGKLVTEGAKAKLGMTVDEVHAGAHALITSTNRPFEPEEHERFSSSLDAIYAAFVERVAAGRHLTTVEVDAVARGRVWTGEDAASRGLVDRLGGFREALACVRELVKLPPEHRLRLVAFPRKVTARSSQRARQRSIDDATPAAARMGGGPTPAADVALALAGLIDEASSFEALARLTRQVVGQLGALHLGSDSQDWFLS